MEATFLRSVDEPEVVVRIDHETLQDWRQVVRDLAALAFDDRTPGPVDKFEVVLDLAGNCIRGGCLHSIVFSITNLLLIRTQLLYPPTTFAAPWKIVCGKTKDLNRDT